MKLRQICLVASELDTNVEHITAVLGLEVAYNDPGVGAFGLVNAVMPVGTQFLEVVSPAPRPDGSSSDTVGGRFLDRRGGDGGYMVILQTVDLEADKKRLAQHQVRIVWQASLDDISAVHLHPRDVGGAIVSFDEPVPPESWRWGGPGWQKKVRTDVVESIRGAELQCADPAEMATRWSALLDVPASQEGAHWVLRLEENRWIRMTRPIDDRGDGLTTVELVAVDRDAALSRARKRQLEVEDGNVVVLSGTRIRLA